MYLCYLLFIIGLTYVKSSECEIQRSEIGELYDIYDKYTCTINYVESDNITTSMIISDDKCYQIIHMVNTSFPYYKNEDCVDEIEEIHDGWVLHLNENDYITIDKDDDLDNVHASGLQQFIIFFLIMTFAYSVVMSISCIIRLLGFCLCQNKTTYIRFMIFISRILRLNKKNPENGLGDICVICHEDMEPFHRRIRLGCRHVYHSECILEWMVIKQECPIDRTEISLLRGISLIEPIDVKPTVNNCEHIA